MAQVFAIGMLSVLMCPPLVFVLEPFWAYLVTVIGRDLFDHREQLEPQEARAPAAQKARAVFTPSR